MATYIFKRKTFTQWDETDNLKRMKDSDILAEKPKSTTVGTGAAIKAGAVGTAIGLGTGAAIGGVKGGIKPAAGMGRMASIGKGMKSAGIAGAVIGGIGASALAYNKAKKQQQENQFYNQRLAYAKRQALRREKKDWKTNMTQRDGYSY
jgi:hypothetical protein